MDFEAIAPHSMQTTVRIPTHTAPKPWSTLTVPTRALADACHTVVQLHVTCNCVREDLGGDRFEQCSVGWVPAHVNYPHQPPGLTN